MGKDTRTKHLIHITMQIKAVRYFEETTIVLKFILNTYHKLLATTELLSTYVI